MGKGAFRTPVYLFGSTRSGVGKSTLLAQVAVYSHARGARTAIIDLNHAFPLQIRNALPRSLPLEVYADLSEISQQISPRFRRSFYFTNVDRLSYFPGFKIPGPLALLQDTSYRDFFLQLRGSFDQVFISLPPGIQEFACLEMFASKRYAR
ncbi:MAG TPA: hypothetical protein PKO06_14385, partial [Candidatus Ozemobacteraceae bacterium]|nr:hypothetical protein [Candidatus Ozemobacteraceae bacterium]